MPHLELDEHFDSIDEAWSFAIRCISNSPLANQPASWAWFGGERRK